MTISMGRWDLIKYHSDKLIADDVSLSVIVDSLNGMSYSAGQQMLSMGADLVEVGDDYSILMGADESWDYYGKVIDADTTRVITVMLRYNPEHGEAVEPLREWVNNFSGK